MRALTRVLAKVSRRADQTTSDPLEQLEALVATGQDVDEAIDREVVRAREAGHTFAVIGGALGTSMQAAHARYNAAAQRYGR